MCLFRSSRHALGQTGCWWRWKRPQLSMGCSSCRVAHFPQLIAHCNISALNCTMQHAGATTMTAACGALAAPPTPLQRAAARPCSTASSRRGQRRRGGVAASAQQVRRRRRLPLPHAAAACSKQQGWSRHCLATP